VVRLRLAGRPGHRRGGRATLGRDGTVASLETGVRAGAGDTVLDGWCFPPPRTPIPCLPPGAARAHPRRGAGQLLDLAGVHVCGGPAAHPRALRGTGDRGLRRDGRHRLEQRRGVPLRPPPPGRIGVRVRPDRRGQRGRPGPPDGSARPDGPRRAARHGTRPRPRRGRGGNPADAARHLLPRRRVRPSAGPWSSGGSPTDPPSSGCSGSLRCGPPSPGSSRRKR
jgi:hypothetical protein